MSNKCASVWKQIMAKIQIEAGMKGRTQWESKEEREKQRQKHMQMNKIKWETNVEYKEIKI